MGIVRGHFRRTRSGKRTWVRTYVRGRTEETERRIWDFPLGAVLRYVRGRDPIDSLLNIASRREEWNAVLEDMANIVIGRLREESGRFARTGTLSGSFYYRQTGEGSGEIASDVPYMRTWSWDEYQGSPPVQNLLEWMDLVEDFDGYDFEELRSIAWAIRFSIIRGPYTPGSSRSTLRRLPPYGVRYYDYITEAIRQSEPEILDIARSLLR
jgi:hypothetical protein